MRNRLYDKAGSILIVSLWIVSLLSLFAFGLTSMLRLSIRQEQWSVALASSKTQIASLAEYAALRLAQDADLELDSLQEEWAVEFRTSSDTLAAGFDGDDPSTEFELVIVAIDEGAKIHVNLASEELLIEALKEAGEEASASRIAAAIMDWRDPDHDGPAEDSYTISAERVYEPANRDLRHIEELLFVEGITPELFFGEDANHNGKLDPEEDDEKVFDPPDDADGHLQPGLIDLFTAYGSGTININGASEWVLRSVLRVALSPSEAHEITRKVLRRRQGPDGVDGTDDDQPFRTEDEIVETLKASYGQLLGAGIELVTESEAFRFYVRVESSKPYHVLEGDLVLVREDGAIVVKEWHTT